MQFEYHSPAPNSALVLYRDQASAQQALDASPIRFALERVAVTTQAATETDDFDLLDQNDDYSPLSEDASSSSTTNPPVTGIDDIIRPSSLLTRTSPTPPSTPSTAPPPLPHAPPTPKPKTESRWFQVTVDRSHAVHVDYVERQPYWRQFEPMKSLAQLDLEKKVPHAGLSDVSKRPPNAYRTPNWVLKVMNEHLAKGQESLVKMWQGGEREDKEGTKR